MTLGPLLLHLMDAYNKSNMQSKLLTRQDLPSVQIYSFRCCHERGSSPCHRKALSLLFIGVKRNI